jgi:hypothetical protein
MHARPLTKKELLAVLAVLALTIGGVIGIGVWFVLQLPAITAAFGEIDAKYYPLIAAIIPSIASLITVGIAYRVWKTQHKNQLSPIRAELYKKQCDIIIKLLPRINKVGTIAFDIMKLQEIPDEESDGRKKLSAVRERIANYLSSHGVFLPSHIIANYNYFSQAIIGMVTLLSQDDKQREEAMRIARAQYSIFVNSCRKMLGTNELSNEVSGLIGKLSPITQLLDEVAHQG